MNDNALDQLTPNALYWIGFLYADGHIESDRSRILLTLQPGDIEHLEKLKEFLGANSKVGTYEGYKRISFSSKKIHNRLLQLGFTHRKSYFIVPHEDLKNSRDFWRGVLDGDGWIYKTKRMGIGICGHQNTINEFLKFINLCGIVTATKATKIKKRENLWSCDLHDNKAKQVADLLYKDSKTYLNRKYEKYKEFA